MELNKGGGGGREKVFFVIARCVGDWPLLQRKLKELYRQTSEWANEMDKLHEVNSMPCVVSKKQGGKNNEETSAYVVASIRLYVCNGV
ncbi:hypothetical protein GCM10022628_02170 [Anoxybacillus suryakundensis]|uniref:Uncharacterized protein n=1 Tax=Anoxybacillus suryakundensis TaxID=1325335 RepID=A0A0K6GRI2_9BACL|nr:hypothetical protein Ga0061060_1334 [Anoxybacillus suryakundensis]